MLVEVLDHFTKGQSVEFDFVDADRIQLVINGLTTRSGVDPIGFRKRIRDRQLGFRLFPVLFHFQELVLVGQKLLTVSAGVFRLTNDVQVLVSRAVVWVELDGFLELGLGTVKVTHFEGQLAVLDGNGGRQLVGFVLTDVAEGFFGGNPTNEVGQALVVLALEVLRLDMIGVDLEQTLHLEVGLFVVTLLGRCVGQGQAAGSETLDGDVAFLFNAGTQFLGQVPCILVGFGR